MPNKGKGKGKAVMAAPPVTCQQDCSGCGQRCPKWRSTEEKMFVGAAEQLMKGLAIWLMDTRDRDETASAGVRAARQLLDALSGAGTAGYSISEFERELQPGEEKTEEKIEAPAISVTASTQTWEWEFKRRGQQDLLEDTRELRPNAFWTSISDTYRNEGVRWEAFLDAIVKADGIISNESLPPEDKRTQTVTDLPPPSSGRMYAEVAVQAVLLDQGENTQEKTNEGIQTDTYLSPPTTQDVVTETSPPVSGKEVAMEVTSLTI
ncbi:hypothetical protein EV426DRAFT_684426 [Tirmania nivea]|nr:hypothetical protein EV426DRAFT_684426 [Tirmania nivea]